jgi:hypothetical protein
MPSKFQKNLKRVEESKVKKKPKKETTKPKSKLEE